MPRLTAKREAHWNREPSVVIAEIKFTINGGDIRNDKLRKVRHAMLQAMSEAAVELGMEWGAAQEMRSMPIERFDKWMVTKGFNRATGGNQPSEAERAVTPSASEA